MLTADLNPKQIQFFRQLPFLVIAHTDTDVWDSVRSAGGRKVVGGGGRPSAETARRGHACKARSRSVAENSAAIRPNAGRTACRDWTRLSIRCTTVAGNPW